jgi:hypothetical protein
MFKAAGLLPIKEYIAISKNTFRTYMENTAIYNNCINIKASPRNSAQIIWWKDGSENTQINENVDIS